MPDREQRAAQAAKHIALMKGVFSSEIEASIASARIYEDGQGRELELPEAQFEATATSVTTDFAPKALYAATGSAVIIDAGAFTRPGGNYEGGAFGPEQVLCADSDLYPILCGLKDAYYEKNRGWESGQLFSDRALYVPDVAFSRNGSVKKADVVVIAAPNRTRALQNNRSVQGCDQALGFRIEAMLRVAATGGASTLICGAFGCGNQGNDAAQVAGLIKNWIEAHPGIFEQVVFAVPRQSFSAFDAVFGQHEDESREPEPNTEPDEAEDEESWRDTELPEGITLR